MLNIVLFGPPGAGKGTQSEKLINKYDLIHLSTGDIFRANIKGQTELGNLAKSYMDQGQLVPDAVTIRMLEAEVLKNRDAKGFIFDGFPRTQAQAIALDALLAGIGTRITLMLALEVEEGELKKRLLMRGQSSGRADDQNPEVIQNRIDVYNRETAPVKEYYTSQGKYEGVYGIGEIEEIFGDLCSIINKYTSNITVGNYKAHQVTKPSVTSGSSSTTTSSVKKAAAKPAKKAAKKATKKATKKSSTPAKKSAKKVVKKATKKAVKKAAKKATKKVVKKAVKSAKKVSKPARPVKAAKKVAKKKTVKKAVKASNKKKAIAPKKSIKKSTKKVAKKIVKKAAKKAAKPARKPVAKKVKVAKKKTTAKSGKKSSKRKK